MPADLIVKLDVLRHQWEKPIFISKHPKAIGRKSGKSQSYHNIEYHGMVLAIDIQPEGLYKQSDAYGFYLLAQDVGFTGIGFYPNWNPNAGFHLDVRRERRPRDPALWGFVMRNEQLVQTSINDALDTFI